MIDQWFKKDLENIFKKHSAAVFIDEFGEVQFLLKRVEKEYKVYIADSEIEELHIKYLIEKTLLIEQLSLVEQKQRESTKHLIYTNTAKDHLKFIREYCETNGLIEIRNLSNYIKRKVHSEFNLNINLSQEEIVAAAKVSIGKDKDYWLDICHKGAGEIFDLKKELLLFLNGPEIYSKEQYNTQLRETFYRKVNDLLQQQYTSKPANTLASEVVNKMLDGLAYNSCSQTLETLYYNWIDSVNYRNSFDSYLNRYKLPSDIDIWGVNPNHPFRLEAG